MNPIIIALYGNKCALSVGEFDTDPLMSAGILRARAALIGGDFLERLNDHEPNLPGEVELEGLPRGAPEETLDIQAALRTWRDVGAPRHGRVGIGPNRRRHDKRLAMSSDGDAPRPAEVDVEQSTREGSGLGEISVLVGLEIDNGAVSSDSDSLNFSR